VTSVTCLDTIFESFLQKVYNLIRQFYGTRLFCQVVISSTGNFVNQRIIIFMRGNELGFNRSKIGKAMSNVYREMG